MRGTGIRLQARTRHYVSVMLDTLEARDGELISHVLHPAKGGGHQETRGPGKGGGLGRQSPKAFRG